MRWRNDTGSCVSDAIHRSDTICGTREREREGEGERREREKNGGREKRMEEGFES